MNNAVSLDNYFTGSDVSAALPSGFLWFPCCPSEIKKSQDRLLPCLLLLFLGAVGVKRFGNQARFERTEFAQ